MTGSPSILSLQATRALEVSAAKGGKGKGAEQRIDPLYKNATAQSGQSESRQSAGNADHRAAPGALEAITKPAMQPFLTQRKELQLDDNRSFRMQKEDHFDDQALRGNLNSNATPPGHSEAPCTDTVHGGDSRYVVLPKVSIIFFLWEVSLVRFFEGE